MLPTNEEINARLDVARLAALEAGEITLRYFQREDLEVELKKDSSPVTIADREAEQFLRKRVAEHFPDDAFIGEEFGQIEGTSGYRWIIDPIDGTKSFVAGVPLYGNMVGVEYEDRSIIGVVNIPGLREYIYAATNQGAWHVSGDAQPQRAHVSSREQLSDAVFLACDVPTFSQVGRWEAYLQLQAKARLCRTWGDCYGYLLVATGRADLMVDPIMNVWDAAALQPILEEAGGTFTDWQGKPTIHSGEGIATNGQILEEVLAITRAAPAG